MPIDVVKTFHVSSLDGCCVHHKPYCAVTEYSVIICLKGMAMLYHIGQEKNKKHCRVL